MIFTRILPCKLTPEERIDRASKAHIATLEAERIEDQARAAAKGVRVRLGLRLRERTE